MNNQIMKGDNPLSEKQQKYCGGVLHVGAKQNESCLNNRGWGNDKCYNPYVVCAKSTGTSYRGCGKYYGYETMPMPHLIAYARLSRVKIPVPLTRESLINSIREWKSNK